MPTYDYRGTKCGHECSQEQSITAPPLQRCGKCGGKLEKLLPKSINLIFKGSGFYSTDYRKRESDAAAHPKKDQAKPAASEKKDDG